MLPFEEALETTLGNAFPLGEEEVQLDHSAGRVLSRDVFSDIDMPPFDKSAVDGFACRLADCHAGAELKIIETIGAGSQPLLPVAEGECSRIMTGSMLPAGADTVIMVEDTEMSSADIMKINFTSKRRHICFRAEDIRKGQKILDRGTRLRTPHVAVLAAAGCEKVMVARQPVVAVLSTGNELVEPGVKPEGPQIRNSNSWQLQSQVLQLPVACKYLGIARDSFNDLERTMRSGLEGCDVLILTGGVSMGEFDHVPAVMQRLGAKIIFKSVAIQPGRPTVFARAGNKFIFGLPGNPVSAFVLFEILVKPFLFKMMGCEFKPRVLKVPLGTDYQGKKSPRKSIIPVILDGGEAFPLEYHGSAHIHAYTRADGMMELEAGNQWVSKGEPVNVRLL